MNLTVVNVLKAVLWLAIVFLAFVMQVFPFLLVLTLINISFGVSSEVILILIPVVLFAMLFAGCFFASVRTRKRPPGRLHVYRSNERPDPWRGLVTCLLPHSRTYRMH